jgi:hypothetical protein
MKPTSEVQNLKIILERRGKLWCWELLKDDKTFSGERGEPAEDWAAVAAMVYARQLDLSAHFKKEREKREPSRS